METNFQLESILYFQRLAKRPDSTRYRPNAAHGPSAHANMLFNWFTAIGACTPPKLESAVVQSELLPEWHVRLRCLLGLLAGFC